MPKYFEGCKPVVDVVMPAYNGARYIEKAIDSILRQTYPHFNLIIVEDGSSDDTWNIIKHYDDERIQSYKNDRNRGISYSTNMAIQNGNGKYIALLDDDDMATDDRLEVQVDYLENHSAVDILGGRSALINEEDIIIGYDEEPLRNSKLIRAYLLFYNNKGFANCSTMYRRDFIEKNSIKYEEECYGMQDVKFFMDSARYGTITSIDHLVHFKRVHEMEETVIQRKNNADKRAYAHSRFQNETLLKSGFELNDEELEIIHHMIPECIGSRYTMDELQDLIKVFNKILKQAKQNGIDYYDELEFACKRIIGNRILPRLQSTDLFVY